MPRHCAPLVRSADAICCCERTLETYFCQHGMKGARRNAEAIVRLNQLDTIEVNVTARAERKER